MYIVGQERRLVDPPSQVVAGVRTVTTNMDGRDALPRMSRPFAFKASSQLKSDLFSRARIRLFGCKFWRSQAILPNAPAGNLVKTRSSEK